MYIFSKYHPIEYSLITKEKKGIYSGKAWQTPSESRDWSHITVIMVKYNGNHAHN